MQDDLFTGIIIEESLLDKNVLSLFKIIKTRISKDNNLSTNAGEPIWTLRTVSIARSDIREAVKHLSQSIKLPNWWADLGYENEIFIVFHNKIFKGLKTDYDFRNKVISYGKKVKLPEDQVPLL